MIVINLIYTLIFRKIIKNFIKNKKIFIKDKYFLYLYYHIYFMQVIKYDRKSKIFCLEIEINLRFISIIRFMLTHET